MLDWLLTRLFPNKVINDSYLKRWIIFGRLDERTDNTRSLLKRPFYLPGGRGLYLHRMTGPDAGRHQHDHPWSFWSFVLWGGYLEATMDEYGVEGWNLRQWGNLDYRPALFTHSIIALTNKVTWTLVLTGPREREWGFYVPRDKHSYDWVHFEDYHRSYM